MATFVSADWVADHIGRPGYLIVDPRSAMRYLMGHLRGAVSVPLKKLQDPQGLLLPPDDLARVFGAAGLGDGVVPVLYDGSDGRNAAMHSWILEYLGRDDIHVLDLHYDHWKEQGREVLYRPVGAEVTHLHAAGKARHPGVSGRCGQPRQRQAAGHALH